MLYISKLHYSVLLFFALAGIVDGIFFIYVLSQMRKIEKRIKE